MSGDFPGTPDYSQTNLACDACHGDGDGTGRTYPNDAAGNHDRHAGLGAGCRNCHAATTADGTTIDVAAGRHVNRREGRRRRRELRLAGRDLRVDGGDEDLCRGQLPQHRTGIEHLVTT